VCVEQGTFAGSTEVSRVRGTLRTLGCGKQRCWDAERIDRGRGYVAPLSRTGWMARRSRQQWPRQGWL